MITVRVGEPQVAAAGSREREPTKEGLGTERPGEGTTKSGEGSKKQATRTKVNDWVEGGGWRVEGGWRLKP